MKKFVEKLDSNSACIRKVKEMLEDNGQLFADLAFIKSQFGILVKTITKLQSQQSISLLESMNLEETVLETLQNVPNIPYRVSRKTQSIYAKNTGFKMLSSIAKCCVGDRSLLPPEVMDLQLTPEMSFLKCSPVATADVERSFSKFKHILTKQRETFTSENMKIHMILHYRIDVLN